jgi:hypothetical protein
MKVTKCVFFKDFFPHGGVGYSHQQPQQPQEHCRSRHSGFSQHQQYGANAMSSSSLSGGYMDYNKRRRETSWLFDSVECASSSSSNRTLSISSSNSSSADITYEQMYEYYHYSTERPKPQAQIANNFFFRNNGGK